MQLTNLSPDIVALAVLAGSAFYGAFRGAGGVRILILGAAAGWVAATQLAGSIGSVGPAGTTQVGLLAAVVLAFALTQHGPVRHGSTMVAVVGGIVGGILLLSAGLSVVPTASQKWLTAHSFAMLEVQTFQQPILIGALVVGVLIPILYHRRPRSHH
jgi:uncharacterized membrane protein YeaQ/YmgE (transglycosylase-associated protein family)